LNLTPDLAERWEVSPDGTVYTFYLRQNAKFHDGRPVTAQDVVYSWERAANPALASDTVLTYLGDIVGVREMTEGTADHQRLKIVDDHTLQVTMAPKPYPQAYICQPLFWTKQMWKARNVSHIQRHSL
jgi:oligopeptide transport system substrate-binding protein